MRPCTFILSAAIMMTMLTDCDHPKQTPQRLLPLQGAANVRDLGGYATADGRQVKWRTVLRADALSKLTDADLDTLASLHLRTIVDFRDSAEVANAPDRIPPSVEHTYRFPIETGSLINLDNLTPSAMPTLLVDGYRVFVRDCAPVYREFFRVLQQPDSAPLLFHCSAGKDRTGYGAVLFLLSLGVDRATAIDDYMLSAQTLKEKYAPSSRPVPRWPR